VLSVDGTEVWLLNTASGSLAYMAGLWMAMAPVCASAFRCQGHCPNGDISLATWMHDFVTWHHQEPGSGCLSMTNCQGHHCHVMSSGNPDVTSWPAKPKFHAGLTCQRGHWATSYPAPPQDFLWLTRWWSICSQSAPKWKCELHIGIKTPT